MFDSNTITKEKGGRSNGSRKRPPRKPKRLNSPSSLNRTVPSTTEPASSLSAVKRKVPSRNNSTASLNQRQVPSRNNSSSVTLSSRRKTPSRNNSFSPHNKKIMSSVGCIPKMIIVLSMLFCSLNVWYFHDFVIQYINGERSISMNLHRTTTDEAEVGNDNSLPAAWRNQNQQQQKQKQQQPPQEQQSQEMQSQEELTQQLTQPTQQPYQNEAQEHNQKREEEVQLKLRQEEEEERANYHHQASPIPGTLIFWNDNENVQNTISLYRDYWGQSASSYSNIPIIFLHKDNNKVCLNEINKLGQPKLLSYYQTLSNKNNNDAANLVPWKNYICTIITLYNNGGYFFDFDVEHIRPIPLMHKYGDVSFSTVNYAQTSSHHEDNQNRISNSFYFSFLAASPQHPILDRVVKNIVDFTTSQPEASVRDAIVNIKHNHHNLTIAWAIQGLPRKSQQHGLTYIMKQNSLRTIKSQHMETQRQLHKSYSPSLYEQIPLQNGYGSCCNQVVYYHHNPDDNNKDNNPTPTTTSTTEIRKSKPEAYFYAHSTNSAYNDCCHKLRIPRRFIFTAKNNILEDKEPKDLYDNLQQTITGYRMAWQDNATQNVPIMFMDDADCEKEIIQVSQDLLDYFHFVGIGAWKSDICRVAALYNHGGYYFDNDMKLVEPILFDDVNNAIGKNNNNGNIRFATVFEPSKHGFFQSFLASEAKHPILKQAVQEMLDLHFQRKDGCTVNMGTCILKRAYDAVSDTDRELSRLYQEDWLSSSFYPSLPRQVGYGACCNFIVHDPEINKVHFYSRFPGASYCCKKERGAGDTDFIFTRPHYPGHTRHVIYQHGDRKESKRIFVMKPKPA